MNKRMERGSGRPITAQRAGVTVTRVGANLGAEISGVDLRRPLPDDAFGAIEEALVEHELIIFRGQDITSDNLMEFGRRFGDLTVHPFSPNDEKAPQLIKFRNDETNAAVRHRRLALRRDLPRRAADGDGPVRQGGAGGRRRHHVRQHVGGIRRPQRPDAAVHLRARGHPRPEAVPRAVRRQRGGPQEPAALRAASIRRSCTRWCASIQCRAARCCSSIRSSRSPSKTWTSARAAHCWTCCFSRR